VVRKLRLTPFYDTPQPFPPGKPGELIRSESFDDYDLPLSVNAVRILYHSRSAIGEDVAASGVVLFPAEMKPPAGGWPVIAWAHGGTGVARACAPSLRRNLEHGSFLSMYVNLGYAVIATDYTGLGTKFRNAFLDAPSNATDVIASIPAARAAVPQLGSRWIVIGAAEGSLTAVAVAEKQSDSLDQGYLGAIAVSDIGSAGDVFEHTDQGSPGVVLAFLAYGVKTVYAQFQPADVLTPKGRGLYHQIEQECSEAGAIAQVASADVMKANWHDNKFVREYLERSRPGNMRAYGPILLISSNQTVSQRDATSRMCKEGDRVQWVQYPDLDAGRVIGDSVRDQIAWIEDRFAARPPITNCP
jgi:Secretory lipase